MGLNSSQINIMLNEYERELNSWKNNEWDKYLPTLRFGNKKRLKIWYRCGKPLTSDLDYISIVKNFRLELDKKNLIFFYKSANFTRFFW